MRTIKAIIFGLICFLAGSITAIMIFLKTLLDIDLIVGLKKVITDKVKYWKYSDYYKNPEYKVKHQRYSNYYGKIENMPHSFSMALERIDYIKNISFKTYDEAEKVVCEIRRYIDDYADVTINDIVSIMGHHEFKYVFGDKWGYDSQFINIFKVNPNGKFGQWTIDIECNPIRLNRE